MTSSASSVHVKRNIDVGVGVLGLVCGAGVYVRLV